MSTEDTYDSAEVAADILANGYYPARDYPLGSVEGLLASRARWLRVDVVRSKTAGWDIVLRLDGSYSSKETAERTSQWFNALVRAACLDVATRKPESGSGKFRLPAGSIQEREMIEFGKWERAKLRREELEAEGEAE